MLPSKLPPGRVRCDQQQATTGMLLAAYTLPHTRHDVVNTGDVVFRFVYVAARARLRSPQYSRGS